MSVAAEYPLSVFVGHTHDIVIDLLLWNRVVLGVLVVAAVATWVVSRSLRMCWLEA
jgi:hypothetical protein